MDCFFATQFWQGNVPSQADHAQRADPIPVQIDFVPCQAVPSHLRKGMMIVVPAFAKRQDRYPETVGGVVSGHEALRSPHVGGGVHEPSGVQAKYGANECAPQQVGQASEEEQSSAHDDLRNPVPLADPGMKFVFTQVGDVGEEGIDLVVHGLAGKDPSHVGPDAAFARRVRVAFFIRILVMFAVRGDPEDRSAFEGQGCAGGQEIFDPFWSFVAAMRKEPMVAHPDSQTSCNPPQQNCHQERLPSEKEKCRYCTDVKRDHEGSRNPIHRLSKCLVTVIAGHGPVPFVCGRLSLLISPIAA